HAGGALVEVLLLEQCGLAAQKAGRDPLDRGGTAIADHHERWLDEHREALTLQPLLELGGTRLELLQRGPRLFLLLGLGERGADVEQESGKGEREDPRHRRARQHEVSRCCANFSPNVRAWPGVWLYDPGHGPRDAQPR